MRKLLTYRRPQYTALVNSLADKGFERMSLLEISGSDKIAELSFEGNLVVDISSFTGLLQGDPGLAARFEVLVHQLPPSTVFIGDKETVDREAYGLRTVFDSMEDCGIDTPESREDAAKTKKTLASLSDCELEGVLSELNRELIEQDEFKQAFESQARSFRLFNALGEQPILSLLLLGPSGVGKTETAKILCNAIAPGQPLPKINLGNYSSKDSLNSLIGSPRGYMGSEEGELGRKIDSSKAGVLLVDEFEKAEPAVWNFFLDLLETGTFTDSQAIEHELYGFTIVFTTNCPLERLTATFPAELLSRFSLKARLSLLSAAGKRAFVERYISRVCEKYRNLPLRNLPELPENIVDRALAEIDVESIDNIRILKNVTRSWIGALVEKTREGANQSTHVESTC